MRRRRRPFGPPAVVFRLLVVVFVVVSVSFFASMRAANALSADESVDDDDDERVEFDVDADDYSNAFATLMNAAEDDDDENMESYALQLDDFTGEILKPPRQKARREPEWMASLTSSLASSSSMSSLYLASNIDIAASEPEPMVAYPKLSVDPCGYTV